MTCLAIERLAAAASGEDVDAVAHAAACARCAALLGEQHEIVAAARALPAPPLSRAHRDELVAELAARLEWRSAAAFDEEPRRRWGFALAGVLAVAAAIAFALFATHASPEAAVATAPPPPAVPPPVAVAPIAPPQPPPVIAKQPAPIVRPRPARHAGSAVAIVAPAPAELPAPPPKVEHPATDSMLAFRAGWQALRNGRNAEAIAAFDRATDPAVVEDATFWAAIAVDRAGDHASAKRRLRDFLEQYPQSPHTDAARAALATP